MIRNSNFIIHFKLLPKREILDQIKITKNL